MDLKRKYRKGQEEMLGFALIMIIVAVILVIFLGFSLRKPQKESLESYEVDSFIQAFLPYTTGCGDNLGFITIQGLLFDCLENSKCLDGRGSCEVLNSTLSEIIDESWKVGEDRPIKGYELIINSNEEEMLFIPKGKITSNSKGSMQSFSRGGDLIEIFFTAYY